MTNTTMNQFKFEGMTYDEAMEAILSDKANTVPVIEEALDTYCVDYKKRMLKSEKVSLLVSALLVETEEKEEAIVMDLQRNDAPNEALNKKLSAPNTTPEDNGLATKRHMDTTPAFNEMVEKSTALAEGYLKDAEVFNVKVRKVELYKSFKDATQEEIDSKRVRRKKRYGKDVRWTVGAVTIQVPAGLLQIKVWDPTAVNSKGRLGMPAFEPFEKYDLDTTVKKYNMFEGPEPGNGFIKLPIIETVKNGVSGGLKVTLPKEFRKLPDGSTRFEELFKTADIEGSSIGSRGLVHKAHLNGLFNAQVSRYVQAITNTAIHRNPENHRSFDKTSCLHKVFFDTQKEDDITDDLMRLKRNILHPIASEDENQIGDQQPNHFCGLKKEWVDMEGVKRINESYGYRDRNSNVDDRFAMDERGNYRQPRADEIINGGRIMKKKDIISEAIAQHCAGCELYCGNSQEFRETPSADAQLIETGFLDERGVQRWVSREPHELVDEADIELNGLRVRSIKMIVTGTFALDYTRIQPIEVEPVDKARINVHRAFAALRYGIYRYYALTEEQHASLVEMEAPENMTEEDTEKWNMLVEQYNNKALAVYEENRQAEEMPEFPQYFFAGRIRQNMDALENPETAIEVSVNDVMAEILKKNDDGFLGYGLGFEGMTPQDIAKGLDDYAKELVFDVIADGVEVCITNGFEDVFDEEEIPYDTMTRTAEEVQHAADGLQALLQMELTGKPEFFSNGQYHDASYLEALKREEDPIEKLLSMKVTDVVKGYLFQLLQ